MSFHALKSVLSAMLGIQHSKHAADDFGKGNPWVYLLIGIICLVTFILILMFVVRIVLN